MTVITKSQLHILHLHIELIEEFMLVLLSIIMHVPRRHLRSLRRSPNKRVTFPTESLLIMHLRPSLNLRLFISLRFLLMILFEIVLLALPMHIWQIR